MRRVDLGGERAGVEAARADVSTGKQRTQPRPRPWKSASRSRSNALRGPGAGVEEDLVALEQAVRVGARPRFEALARVRRQRLGVAAVVDRVVQHRLAARDRCRGWRAGVSALHAVREDREQAAEAARAQVTHGVDDRVGVQRRLAAVELDVAVGGDAAQRLVEHRRRVRSVPPVRRAVDRAPRCRCGCRSCPRRGAARAARCRRECSARPARGTGSARCAAGGWRRSSPSRRCCRRPRSRRCARAARRCAGRRSAARRGGSPGSCRAAPAKSSAYILKMRETKMRRAAWSMRQFHSLARNCSVAARSVALQALADVRRRAQRRAAVRAAVDGEMDARLAELAAQDLVLDVVEADGAAAGAVAPALEELAVARLPHRGDRILGDDRVQGERVVRVQPVREAMLVGREARGIAVRADGAERRDARRRAGRAARPGGRSRPCRPARRPRPGDPSTAASPSRRRSSPAQRGTFECREEAGWRGRLRCQRTRRLGRSTIVPRPTRTAITAASPLVEATGAAVGVFDGVGVTHSPPAAQT